MTSSILEKLSEQYPFITLCVYAQNEYIGIIQNQDNNITSLYDYGSVIDASMKQLFIDLGNAWWWESNRSIPINIFLKAEWEPFRPYLKTFANKDLQIIHGPVCSLGQLNERKSKKRSITLVKRVI
jgi:hypothetical protein